MKENTRRALRIVGLLLIVAALGVVGYALNNIIQTDLATQRSLQQAQALVEDLKSPSPSDDWTLANFEDPNYTPPPDTLDDSAELTVPPDDPGAAQPTPPPAADASQPAANGSATSPGAAKKVAIMGVLVFDGLGGRKVPVVEGASASALNRGAGHHPRTSLPGRTGNCVIFGHRNTVFTGFGGLKLGQTVRFEGAEKNYTYKITAMRVVNPDDPAIFAVHSGAVMSLVTCYPFHYVGSAPQRYLVTCELVS